MTKTPDQRLILLAELFKSRNAAYGNTYVNHGHVMLDLFCGEIPTIFTKKDSARMGVLNMIVSKLTRYCQNWNTGHVDSLDDLTVYAQMLQHLDSMEDFDGSD